MRFTIDEGAQAVYLYLREILPGEAKQTLLTGDINLDIDANGHLIGIEMLSLARLPPVLLKQIREAVTLAERRFGPAAALDDPQARINLLEESLRMYGGHVESCPKRPCQCGFKEVWENILGGGTHG